jgi:hypothetical protein
MNYPAIITRPGQIFIVLLLVYVFATAAAAAPLPGVAATALPTTANATAVRRPSSGEDYYF